MSTLLQASFNADGVESDEALGSASGYAEDEDLSVRVSNPAAENGEIEASRDGLSWLNSAAVHAEPGRDRVILTCSVGDPRGAFVFEIRRDIEGRIHISTPYPGEGLPHMNLAKLGEGHYIVTHEAGRVDKAIVFSMDESDESDDDVEDE